VRQAAAVHVHRAELGAAVQGRHGAAGVQEALGVEGGLETVEGLELGRAELHAHRVELLDADAVLAGDRAADLDAQFEDARAERLGTGKLFVDVRVVGDQRVEIAVAGMEDVRDRQAILGREMRASTRDSSRRGMVPSMQ